MCPILHTHNRNGEMVKIKPPAATRARRIGCMSSVRGYGPLGDMRIRAVTELLRIWAMACLTYPL
jgi:hypothetical protein